MAATAAVTPAARGGAGASVTEGRVSRSISLGAGPGKLAALGQLIRQRRRQILHAMTVPSAITETRSTRFSSSRTLPGQS